MTCLFMNTFKSRETKKIKFLRSKKYQGEVCWNEIKYNFKYLEWIKKKEAIQQRKILRNKKKKIIEE